jgi:exosortase E/protease (VPEID-CTERM system)
MGQQVSKRWFVRPTAALVLLATEYLLITVAFDAIPLMRRAGVLGGFARIGLVGPAVLAFASALWVLGGDQIRTALAEQPQLGTGKSLWRLGLHLLCFATFFLVTAAVFGGDDLAVGSGWLWASLWLLTGIASVYSWLRFALGTSSMVSVARELAVPVGISSIVAFFAVTAGLISVGLWRNLSHFTMHSVAWLLDVLVSPIRFDPSTAEIGTERFYVIVAPVCSGYEGIGLIVVFVSAYLIGFRRQLRFPNALVLLPLGVALIALLNVARIVSLILVGHYISEGIAVSGFHSKAGWIAFCGVALGLVWLTHRVAWFQRDPHEEERTVNPSAPFLLPLLAVVATSLLTGLFVDGLDYFYPARVLVAFLVLTWYRDAYESELRASLAGRSWFSWKAVGIGCAVYVVWVAISSWTLPELARDPPEALAQMSSPLRAAWVVARVLGSVVTVPIVEELAFRGFLLRRIISSDFAEVSYERWSWPAVVISSVAFAALHQQWVGGFIAGVAYAYAQKQRGLVSDAMIAHAVTNGLIAIEVLTVGHWALW